MALLELIFRLPKNKRCISFEQIKEATLLNVNEVEMLLMKAMSLDLIKGQINQVIIFMFSIFLYTHIRLTKQSL